MRRLDFLLLSHSFIGCHVLSYLSMENSLTHFTSFVNLDFMISFVTKSYLLLAPTSTPDMLLQLITVQLATRMGGFKTMLQRHLLDMNFIINFNLQSDIRKRYKHSFMLTFTLWSRLQNLLFLEISMILRPEILDSAPLCQDLYLSKSNSLKHLSN